MDILYSWLKEYLTVDISAEEAADLLTNIGLESSVRGAVPKEALQYLDKVVIARIEKIEKHPNADKLTFCQVKPSEDSEPLPIVCGAPNIKVGDKVPLALVGAKLATGVLKESIIRGMPSKGMMCAEDELGLGPDHSGIIILPKDVPLGMPFKEWLLKKDVVLSVEPTPNRGDLLCVLGVARELSAATGTKVRYPEINFKEEPDVIEEKAEVIIEDYEGCPRYVARLVEDIKLGQSPDWMRNRLEASGIRAIVNVVDITNYVMLEMGQPLHAFDFDLLRGQKIVVRRAKQGEKFTTLDGIERVLGSEILLICDGEGPVAIAGIMGGANSEVNEHTRNILIESAFFDPKVIRRGAQKLIMKTEASVRFEHRIDPIATERAADRAVQLMQELAGAKVLRGRLDAYEKLLKPAPIKFRVNQVSRLLGFSIPSDNVKAYFERLEMSVEKTSDEELVVIPHPARGDILSEIDLIEEVARMYGYDKNPAELPEFRMQTLPRSQRERMRNRLSELLLDLGFSEVINYNFQSKKDIELLNLKPDDPRRNAVKIENPLGENWSYLRTSLIPQMLFNVSFNFARQQELIKIFEFNKVFLPAGKPGELLIEREMLAGIISRRDPKSLWNFSCPAGGFYEVKRIVEAILEEMRFPGARIEPAEDVPYFLPGKTARVMLGKDRAGQIGEIDPRVLKNFEIEVPVFAFELDLELMLQYARKPKPAETPSRFPASYRDISFLVAEAVTHQEVVALIRGIRSELVSGIELFDIYRGDKLPAGKKSMTYRLWYQSSERTLTDDEVNALHAKVAMRLKEKLGAEIR